MMLQTILASAIGMTLIGCSGIGPTPNDRSQSDDEDPRTAQQGFHNDTSTKSCSAPVDTLLRSVDPVNGIGGYLEYTIADNNQEPWNNCLNDSFISEIANGYSIQDISAQFQKSDPTTITCANQSALPSVCNGYYDALGCASLNSAENITLANELFDMRYHTVPNMASVMAHELAHTYGHPHSNDKDSEYAWTVPERAAACVGNGNVLPFGQSRTVGMPGEVELAPAGRSGNGSPFTFYGIDDQYVSAIAPASRSAFPNNKYVDYLGVQFTSASTGASSLANPDHVGADCYNSGTALCVPPTPDKYPWISCGANEVPIGIQGEVSGPVQLNSSTPAPTVPKTQYVNNLGLICFNYVTGVVHDTVALPGMSGWHFRQQCPSNQLIRGIRGQVGGQLSQIQLICDYWGKSFSADHAPHAVGKVYGSTSNVKFSVRCSGNGALSALNGRADSTIRRLGATCMPTGGTLPVTPQGPEHPATPYVGAWPDSKGKTAGAIFGRAHCGNGELMVGLQVRSSSSAVNGISPICANADQWDNYSSGNYNLNAWNGAKTGTVYDQYCPAYQFMVGYDVWSGSSVNGIQVVCADMR